MKTGENEAIVDPQYIKRRSRLALLVERVFVLLMNASRSRDRPGRLPSEGKVRSVLVIRHNQLGDAVAASPFIAAIRALWPNATVHVMASKANAEAFSWVEGVDAVFVRPAAVKSRYQLYRRLRGQYDVVFQTLVDEHYFWRTMTARYLASDGLSVGRKRGTPIEELFDCSVYLPPGGYVRKLMSLLQPFTSLTPEEMIARHPTHCIQLPQEAVQQALAKLEQLGVKPNGYIALNISARLAFRQLGVEQAARLANAYRKKGLLVVLLHAPEDQSRAEALARLAPGLLIPRFASLAEAMAAAQQAQLYVGADTGTAHFAAAGLTPCLVLFAHQARADHWAPYGVPFVAIQANPQQEVAQIDAELVLEYSDRLLAGEPLLRIVRSTPDGFSLGAVSRHSVSAA